MIDLTSNPCTVDLTADTDAELNTRALRLLVNLNGWRAKGDRERVARAERLHRSCLDEIARRKRIVQLDHLRSVR